MPGKLNSTYTNRYLYVLFAICFASGMLGATTSTLMSSFLPDVIKELTGNSNDGEMEKTGAIINSMFLFGWMFGGILWGMICDRMGRKTAVVFSTAFYALFTLLTAFAPSWMWIVLCRFFSGFGVGGVIVSTTILISEVWPAHKRAVAIGMLTICFPVGVFLAGAITWSLPGWRTAFLIGFIPLSLSIFSFFILKEPKNIEHRDSSKLQKENFNGLFHPSNRKKLFVGAIVFGTMLIGLWAIFNWLPSWIQGLLENVDGQKERGMAMMSLAGAALLGGSFSGWFSKLVGWRKSMLACFAVCFLMSFILFKQTSSFSAVIFIEIGLLGFFFGISQGVLSDYITKIFPVSIRATATGFCFNAGRLFTATIVFFVGWLVNIFGGYGNSIFIFSWVFVIGFIATFFIKETSMQE